MALALRMETRAGGSLVATAVAPSEQQPDLRFSASRLRHYGRPPRRGIRPSFRTATAAAVNRWAGAST
eukprot:3462284-Pyramimonas_sp.AAC.1